MRSILTTLCLLLALPPLLAGAGSAYHPGPEVNRYWQRHESLCGQPVSSERLGHGMFAQSFQRCVIAGNVGIVRSPTPTPSPSPTPSPVPTSTPWPTPTPGPSDGVHYLLGLINSERASHGYAPLTLDPDMSNGTGDCMGAIGHARSMRDRGTIGHWDFPGDLCGAYSVGAENVGVGAYGSEQADIDAVQQQMLSEPWSPGCQGSHHCNEDDTRFTRIGLAIVPGQFQGYSAHYISEEFAGP